MPTKLFDYTIRGTRAREGITVARRGLVSLYDDGKITGTIWDNPLLFADTYVFLGLMSPNYLKIDFATIRPGCWPQEAQLFSVERRSPGEEFAGVWNDFSNAPIIREVERAVNRESPDFNLLANVSPLELLYSWNFGKINPQVKREAKIAGRSASLRFINNKWNS